MTTLLRFKKLSTRNCHCKKQLLVKRGVEGYGWGENEVEKLVKLLSNYRTQKSFIDQSRCSVQLKT